MAAVPSRSAIRTMLWFMRGVGLLMLVVSLLRFGKVPVLSLFNAVLIITIVVSFIIEPRLLTRFAAPSDQTSPLPPQPSWKARYADAHFALVVGLMRFVGGLFVVAGLFVGTMTVSHWSQFVRDDGGAGAAVGALLFVSAFVALGILLVLGRHIPLMRAFREMGERQRR